MTFKEWTTWLETRNIAPTIAPGLGRTEEALQKAGLIAAFRPERTIHIAGTNGKGTTARALEHLLVAAGQTVGLYTSPHLVSTCERLRVNQKSISEVDFVKLCEKHKATIEACNLSHFEALTVMALDYFSNEIKTDWMIFEIGLGGTWDATNAIPHSTSVITSIGYDHMNILGNTLESIASNKFGIIRPGNTVFHRRYNKEIEQLLHAKIESTHSTGHPLELLAHTVAPGLVPQYCLQFANSSIPLQLPGVRTIENVSAAIQVYISLGFNSRYVSSLSTLEWPARMTELPLLDGPCPVYLSGDHNEQGLESLCEILEQSTYQSLWIVLGLSKNRSHEPFVQRLRRLPRVQIVFTAPQFQGVCPEAQFTPFFSTPQECLEYIFKAVRSQQELVVVTGSLYLCGDFLRAFPERQ